MPSIGFWYFGFDRRWPDRHSYKNIRHKRGRKGRR